MVPCQAGLKTRLYKLTTRRYKLASIAARRPRTLPS
jgi:hypothetical protein